MNKKLIYVAVILLMLFMCSQILSLKSEIDNLSQQVSGLRNESRSLNSSLNSIEWTFQKEMEQNNYVQKAEFDVENLNGDFSRAVVDVFVTFNHIKQDDQVKLLYRTVIRPRGEAAEFELDDNDYIPVYVEEKKEPEYGQWQSIPLEKDGGLTYKAQLKGNYHFDYEMQVLIEHGQEAFTEEIHSLNLYSESIPDYYAHVNTNSHSSEGRLQYSAMIEVYNDESPVLLERAELTVYCKDMEIDRVEVITDENLTVSHGKSFTWDMNKTINYDIEKLGGKINPIHYRLIITDEAGRTYEHNIFR